MKLLIITFILINLSCESKTTTPRSVEVKDSPSASVKILEKKKIEPESVSESMKAWPPLSNEEVERVIKVEGMSCQGCADSAADLTLNIPGVTRSKGSFEKGEILVRFKKGKTDGQKIADKIAVTKLEGYPQLKTSLIFENNE